MTVWRLPGGTNWRASPMGVRLHALDFSTETDLLEIAVGR